MRILKTLILSAALVLPAQAYAETWKCEFGKRDSRGWAPTWLFMHHEDGTYHLFEPFSVKRKGTAVPIAAYRKSDTLMKFKWRIAMNTTTQKVLNVSYRLDLNTDPNKRSFINVNLRNSFNQTENARGKCMPYKDLSLAEFKGWAEKYVAERQAAEQKDSDS